MDENDYPMTDCLSVCLSTEYLMNEYFPADVTPKEMTMEELTVSDRIAEIWEKIKTWLIFRNVNPEYLKKFEDFVHSANLTFDDWKELEGWIDFQSW